MTKSTTELVNESLHRRMEEFLEPAPCMTREESFAHFRQIRQDHRDLLRAAGVTS